MIVMRVWSLHRLAAILCLALFVAVTIPSMAATPKRVLLVSVTKGFRHSGAIEMGDKIIPELGSKTGDWQVDFVRNDEDMARLMTADSLAKYDAIVFNNTTGQLPLPDPQAFLSWIKGGGGFVGIHAATDTYHEWPAYIDMIGGQFAGHGPQVEVECLIEDPNHAATRDLPAKFRVFDEIYLHKNFDRKKVRGLITLDKHPNEGTPGDYPIAWCRAYGKGRVFYTSLGHRDDVWESEIYQKHLTGGIRWALGLAKGSATPVAPRPRITRAEKSEGFVPLFNAKDLTGWHPRHEGAAPWTVQNGMLVMGKGGTDLITDEKFSDFIIRYEYMVPKGGNSGVYLRGRYEIQVLDDFDRKAPDIHGNGSIYGLIAPSAFASREAGQWQEVEAKIVGNRVTVVLNGVKIIDNKVLESVTGGALDDKVNEPGPIMLQGDHGPIAYRNIRIKKL